SAWTGTGFTTSESEMVVAHPVRRQIISTLMFLRSVGLITAASTLMISFADIEERTGGFLRLAILFGGVAGLWFLARSHIAGVWMSRLIAGALKRYTDIETRDYEGLLHLAGEYAVMELKLRQGSWLADRSLHDLRLSEEGVLVLGIVHSDGIYVGAPRGDTVLHEGETLVLYGRSPELAALSKRRADATGEQERKASVEIERRVERAEKASVGGDAGGAGR
ncbi:MAG TPA: TrkA C-terminal domain-containing protein, partial [Saliniramus sp.]|nr:TrkA C-terminal domain-containing protein [Saliniramus sp.]